ncbi:hypothetical protein LTR70_000819 [Exophiala xenobiotica]|uniref:Clr5 domain-containing protein n=1 Tax=Lithohypha guttulata TaxID=1690604 RepID=A0ABR0KN32_9EURO|nr:hypothetical protein LTR24_000508 [Lithohypha guttulata]KAK5329322.1 hypothetical protein LTR70_000819 [Exophiala xenobiotica]
MDVRGYPLGNPEPRLPTNADWTWLRPIIEQEYKHAGKTRQQVCEMLLTQHGIKITENVFKKRISLWQLDKKKKRNEMVYAVKKINGRKATGKATSLFIRDEEVTQDDISHYFRRRPLTTTEQHQPLENMPTPTEMVLSTPRCQASILVTAEQTTAPLGLNEIVQTEATSVEYEFFSQQALLSLNETVQRSPSLDEFLDQETQPALRTFKYCPQPEEDFLHRMYHYAGAGGADQAQSLWQKEACMLAVSLGKNKELGEKWWQNNVHEPRNRYAILFHPDDIDTSNGWMYLAAVIARSIGEAAAADRKEDVLNLHYYHISGQLGPTHPAVYLLPSAARADGETGLVDLMASTLPNRFRIRFEIAHIQRLYGAYSLHNRLRKRARVTWMFRWKRSREAFSSRFRESFPCT